VTTDTVPMLLCQGSAIDSCFILKCFLNASILGKVKGRSHINGFLMEGLLGTVYMYMLPIPLELRYGPQNPKQKKIRLIFSKRLIRALENCQSHSMALTLSILFVIHSNF
jgi:hypothetical protein